MISIDTFGDRTVFFDFLPFNLGKMDGFDILVQLYTVPGQVKYKATRELVLRGADGIVFVADIFEQDKYLRILMILQYNLSHYIKTNKKNAHPIAFKILRERLMVEFYIKRALADLKSYIRSELEKLRAEIQAHAAKNGV